MFPSGKFKLSLAAKRLDARHGAQNPERIAGLSWWYSLGDIDQSRPLLKNTTLTQDQLIKQVAAEISGGPPNRPLVIYIHGCCVPYWKSMEAASEVACSLEAPVLLFAWAAVPPTETKYRLNEDRENSGEERFIRLVESMEASIPASRIVLVAHSMGNRLLYAILKTRYYAHGKDAGLPKFACAAFACADVNVNDFANDEGRIAFNTTQTWITKNNTDPALALSTIQRGLYDRLGRPQAALKRLINTDGVDLLDIEEVYWNKHDLPLPILNQAIRMSDTDYKADYNFWQEKQHWLKVHKL